MITNVQKQREKRLAEERNKNLRQLFLGASRALNVLLLAGLEKRGHPNIRLTHSALLANLDMDGNSLNDLAARANMTKQGTGQLARELCERGYVVMKKDAQDGRSKVVRFTDSGWRLMIDSFTVIEEIEERFSNILGDQTMDGLRTGLAAFIGACGPDRNELKRESQVVSELQEA